jgi:hypothetical protein
MRIISFYTDPVGTRYYSDHAARLKKQCERLGLLHTIEQLPNEGSYWANCLKKPRFIQSCYERFSEPLLWLDCDTDLHAPPEDIDPSKDIIAFRIPWYNSTVFMHSYAVYFGRSSKVEALLDYWNTDCSTYAAASRKIGDHGPLCDAVIRDKSLNFGFFPTMFATIGMAPVSQVASKTGHEEYVRKFSDPTRDNRLKVPFQIPLKGGLGNMMFQIAASESHARRHNLQPVFQSTQKSALYERNIFGRVPFCIHPIRKAWTVEHNAFHYEPIVVPKTPLIISGNSYYQSEKYFDSAVAHEMFGPSSSTLAKIKGLYPDIHDSVSVHVRRGDYLTAPDAHPILPLSYYNKCAELLGPQRYLIFTDDRAWCTRHMKLPNSTIMTGLTDWESLHAMSLCSHHIVANSSFSWWGAYLDRSDTKRVLAPSVWFGPRLKNLNTSDLIPQSWEIISI